MIEDLLRKKYTPVLWLGSEHFQAKRMEGGYLRVSVKESRYLFIEDEQIDEVIELLQEVKKKLEGKE